MVATNQDIGGSEEPYYEGDSLEVTFDILADDGSSKDLSDASAEWVLQSSSGTILSSADAGVSIDVVQSNSTVVLTLDSGATDDLSGTYDHYLRIQDGNSQVTVTTGNFTINGL